MTRRVLVSTILATVLMAATAAGAEPPPRTVLHHGKVFTADPARPWAEALVVQGNNILAVGSNAEALAFARPGARIIDLGGRTVVPGLNDAHVHVLGFPGTFLNDATFVPGPGPAIADVVALLKQGAEATPPGTWLVVVVGTAVVEDASVNRYVLDAVTPDHPVRLEVWTGHGIYLNTRAMQALGIGEEERDPFGGRYERFAGTQILNGIAHEYAEHQIRRKLQSLLSDAALAAQYQAYAAQAVQLGFTSVQDMAVGLTRARSRSVLTGLALPIRIRSICFPLSASEPCDDAADQGRVTFSGIKWITDGTPIERLALLLAPYADLAGWVGAFNFPPASLPSLIDRGLEGPPRRRQLLFHAVGDGAIGTILSGLEAVAGPDTWLPRRTRIEHGDLTTTADIGRMVALGAVVVQNPTHLALTGLFAQRFTPDVLARAQPLRSLVQAGVPLALGTDGIGRVQSPWVDVLLATIHPTRPSEALTREQAIAAYTVGSAYAEFEEQQKGMLAPGKLADVVVLSQDVFTVPVPALPATFSLLTMVDGEVVWNAGVLPSQP